MSIYKLQFGWLLDIIKILNLSFDLKHILCIEYFKILYSYIGTDTIIMVLLNWNIWVSMLDFPSSMELSRGSLLTSKGKTCFILLIYTQLLNSSLAIKCATFKVIRIKSFFSLLNHTSTKSTLLQANVQCMQYVSLNCI